MSSEPTDDLPQHLEFIQDVIERHARTSFLLKGWSVTLAAGVFLLAVRGAEPALAMVAGVLPALAFWGLDAYYLRQERLFRALYNHVRKMPPKPDDRFGMDTSGVVEVRAKWLRTLFAGTIFWFHAVVIGCVIAALIWFKARGPDAS